MRTRSVRANKGKKLNSANPKFASYQFQLVSKSRTHKTQENAQYLRSNRGQF